MATIDLSLFKKHVRADDICEDDEYLLHLLDAAEEAVISSTRRERSELEDDGGNLPLTLQHAILLLAAHWYNQRESVAGVQMHKVPDTFDALVKPYRKLVK